MPAGRSTALQWPQTLVALLAPRRLVPIGVVVLTLVGTEWVATQRADATLVLLLFCAAFFAAIPAAAVWAYAGSALRYSVYVLLCVALVLATS